MREPGREESLVNGMQAPVVVIEPMADSDWARVRAIYEDGIATRNATFETVVPDWDKWDAGHLKSCRFVARHGSDVLGWAALSAVSTRCVYSGVAEVSVYVAQPARGRKVGSKLLAALVKASEQEGFWTLQSGIFPENVGSLQLHERFGFRVVGIRQRLGRLEERWRDVVLMERRSEVAGV